MKRILLSWSGGKDSAWALHLLRRSAEYEIVGLLTTFNQQFDRVAMHAVRRADRGAGGSRRRAAVAGPFALAVLERGLRMRDARRR